MTVSKYEVNASEGGIEDVASIPHPEGSRMLFLSHVFIRPETFNQTV